MSNKIKDGVVWIDNELLEMEAFSASTGLCAFPAVSRRSSDSWS